MRIAVDIGGTFTDAVAIDSNGNVSTAKASTTPGHLADGVLDALRGVDVPLGDAEVFVHGTTAGLNALLERRGVRVALLTTNGFRDVYEIGRANRPDMYDVKYRRPAPLVKRRDIFEVTGRLAADGSVVAPVDTDDLRRQIRSWPPDAYESVAVCLLHAYRNPEQERVVAQVIADELPGLPVTLSSELAPEWREFERTSTTVVSAYVAPIVSGYLAQLEERLIAEGLRCPVLVMQSNGGIISADVARKHPVQTLLSGPVGGTRAGVAVASSIHVPLGTGLICIDMGGTSFDVSLVVDGEAQVELQSVLDGHELLAPSVAIHTVGAGGGSVAYSEAGGLRVGPHSAGAVPGPACYGRGGSEPTVTDANLALGRLPASAVLGGSLGIDRAAAEAVLASLGSELDIASGDLAAGIVAIADAAMANAIRELTVFRGIDPRSFALMAFGGAGPLHAVALAEELDIGTVIVPMHPGALSAWGMLHADFRFDRSMALTGQLGQLVDDDVHAATATLERALGQVFATGFFELTSSIVNYSADLRYVGQEYTLTIGLDEIEKSWQEHLRKRFDDAYQIRFGHSNRDEEVEIVNLRATLVSPTAPIPHRSTDAVGADPVVDRVESWADGWTDTPVLDRRLLASGGQHAGPAIVLEEGCTTYIPPDWTAFVHADGHLLLTRSES